MEELEALHILLNTPQLGPVRINALTKYFDSPKKALFAKEEDLKQVRQLNKESIKNLLNWETLSSWKEDLRLIKKHRVVLIPFFSADYPSSLFQLKSPPPMLYIKGKLLKQSVSGIAIVGTRRCTHYGKEMGYNFSKQLALNGKTIFSGLARGIDTCAHLGALEGGETYAVLGSGIDKLYPQENSELASKICHQGGLISEFPMFTPPDKGNFPKRNRIVAALSKSLLLIEAPIKSGAMITMREGEALNKKLYCIPGRIDYESFSGNHELIKKKRATLVEKAKDLLEFSNDTYENNKITIKSQLNSCVLSEDEKVLLMQFPPGECHAEELLLKSKATPGKLSALLMGLVLKGLIKEYPGKFYKKTG